MLKLASNTTADNVGAPNGAARSDQPARGLMGCGSHEVRVVLPFAPSQVDVIRAKPHQDALSHVVPLGREREIFNGVANVLILADVGFGPGGNLKSLTRYLLMLRKR